MFCLSGFGGFRFKSSDKRGNTMILRDNRHGMIGFARRVFLLIFAMLLAVSAALSEAPSPTPVSYTEYNNETEDIPSKVRYGLYVVLEGDERNELFNVKNKLYNFGYYGNNPANRTGNYLDENDLLAVVDCWIRNTSEIYPAPSYGLTYGALDLILNGEIINLTVVETPTEEPFQYADIPWGEGGEALVNVVNRLYDLHYLEDHDIRTYDDTIHDAIALFGQYNGFQNYYSDDETRPITAHLQEVLMGESAKELPPAEPEPTVGGARGYFTRKVSIAGKGVSMLVLWSIGLFVLVVSILAAVYFFLPPDGRKKPSKKYRVSFSITYRGETQEIDVEIIKPLKIGRGVGNFPINLEDTKISRQHCELYFQNDVLMLRDYSANGTTVDGKPINNAECILNSGSVIVIGDHIITITF